VKALSLVIRRKYTIKQNPFYHCFYSCILAGYESGLSSLQSRKQTQLFIQFHPAVYSIRRDGCSNDADDFDVDDN